MPTPPAAFGVVVDVCAIVIVWGWWLSALALRLIILLLKAYALETIFLVILSFLPWRQYITYTLMRQQCPPAFDIESGGLEKPR